MSEHLKLRIEKIHSVPGRLDMEDNFWHLS